MWFLKLGLHQISFQTWTCFLSTLMWMLKEQVADWFVTGLLALGQTIIPDHLWRLYPKCLGKRGPIWKGWDRGTWKQLSSSPGSSLLRAAWPSWVQPPHIWSINLIMISATSFNGNVAKYHKETAPEPVDIGLGLGEHHIDRGGSNWQGFCHVRGTP